MIDPQHLTFIHSLLLFNTAFIAGGLNAVAGGGTFITFPALIFTGVPPITANATIEEGSPNEKISPPCM